MRGLHQIVSREAAMFVAEQARRRADKEAAERAAVHAINERMFERQTEIDSERAGTEND